MLIEKFKNVLIQTVKNLGMITPMLIAVLGLVGLFKVYVTPEILSHIFNKNAIHDTFIGTFAGAISVGQPFVSYIISGELVKEGVSFYAVTAFILSYVTLGVIQLPMEFSIFGSRFTIVRNILSLIFSIIVSWFTVVTLIYVNGVLHG